ncbi:MULTISPECIES: EamA family transporter [unclassified Modestobacter]|uniref:EamA family transporter n=1 Tax=unclassified Modestobacter TaxID=2643866 RepID=UPI0022AB3B71|nr:MULTISPECIES: EamA family transporter [unclassified Modestobacter]MCZ2827032.1 EamA family transporter [Modestobacter sp. VKM Ac-2981]MCZ2855272.1 EamA family transporter [Modestobacter sp. VKM Ac-2982]
MTSTRQIDQPAAERLAQVAGRPAGRIALGTGGAGAGVALMLSSALANQVGAAVGALAFPAIGAVGVVAVRQWVAGIVLVGVVRPRPWRLTAAQWRPVLLLAVVFATMNLSLYAAIERIGLGLAVTLEFLGPLGVALAASRRRRDLVCALVALAGVVALSRPQPTTDHAGIALGLLAAACWAGYILVNRQLGARVPGGTGPATAAGLSALVFLPIGIAVLVAHPPSLVTAGYAVTAGVLASAVPLFVDLLALRRVPAGAYGVFMSIHPVIATVVGLVVLGQEQPWDAWLAIAAIVGANVAGQLPARHRAG